MEYRHEIINFPKKLPIKFFLHRIGDVNRHWHQSLELIVNIKGTVEITVDGTPYTLTSGDIILINSNEIHELHSNDATMIALQIKMELLNESVQDMNKLYFDCNSAVSADSSRFQNIKRIVAEILKHNIGADEYIDLKNASLVYELIHELCTNFNSSKNGTKKHSQESLDRLSRILDYLNSKYREPLTLQSVANIEYLSVPYLSKFFAKSMGVSFKDYLKQVRLHHAVNDLFNDTLTIDMIASNNGFPNTRSFVTAFQKKFNELPSVWRKKHSSQVLGSIEATKEKSVNYYQDEPQSYHEEISLFIDKHIDYKPASIPKPNYPTHSASIYIDTQVPGRQLKHTFKTFTGVSRAKEVLLADVQEALRTAQQEIGFTYIKMHSLLDDDMMVYSEDSQGRPIYNFRLIDKVMDFLLSIRLKPLVQFSFMPSLLASDKSKAVFYKQINTSPPNDMEKWDRLITDLTRHFMVRYGIEEIRSWLFCVWNEPSSSNHLFGFSDDWTFYQLYEHTRTAVKSVDASLQFGGPAAFSTYNKSEDWLFDFLSFSKQQNCIPDFITVHYYDIDLANAGLHHPMMDNQLYLSPVTTSFQQFIDRLQNGLQHLELGHLPVFMTEWNSTVSHKDLVNDTCFKSAYIVKHVIENYDRLDAFGYWLLTDLHEENLLPSSLFHGGLGMFTYNQIKKPAYHAFSLLNKLGNSLVANGDGFMITRSLEGYQIILHNYHHYDEMYAKGISLSISYSERYSHFPRKSKREFQFSLSNMEGDYIITHHYVNPEHGSAFDQEVRMGISLDYSDEEVNYLRSLSIPKIEKEQVSCSGTLLLHTVLEPFEIRLIEVKRFMGRG
ncbi:GH39 family glycosyl hydrolase [Paenibacillus fonticola]|uniref:GH39 family glycosyl hydrolase n=1 Tax=Paenibacillus fonticola TaxID=379896 RepID=UPI0003614D2E|nr:helix-turn-helix domain-containing protein [Paenibacillus fonticola]